MLSANFKPKRTAAASRGFLATARLSCYPIAWSLHYFEKRRYYLCIYNTGWSKSRSPRFCQLHQILTDFQNSFIRKLSNKFAIKWYDPSYSLHHRVKYWHSKIADLQVYWFSDLPVFGRNSGSINCRYWQSLVLMWLCSTKTLPVISRCVINTKCVLWNEVSVPLPCYYISLLRLTLVSQHFIAVIGNQQQHRASHWVTWHHRSRHSRDHWTRNMVWYRTLVGTSRLSRTFVKIWNLKSIGVMTLILMIMWPMSRNT